MKSIFPWLDRKLRPKTTSAIQELVDTVECGVRDADVNEARRAERTADFERQVAENTELLKRAKSVIECEDEAKTNEEAAAG